MMVFCTLYVMVTVIYNNYMENIILFPATVVNFEQRTYSVNEPNGSVQPVLVLSKPSSYNIIVQVLAGEYCLTTYHNYY